MAVPLELPKVGMRADHWADAKAGQMADLKDASLAVRSAVHWDALRVGSKAGCLAVPRVGR